MYESWLSWCARRFRGKFTKLRALELVEFRKRLILDLGIIVIKARGIDNMFMGETLAACFRGNRDSYVESPRRFDAQPYHEGGMIAGIEAGVMLLTPSEHDFTRMQHDYSLETAEATFGPEQDYLFRFYREWKNIPVEFNFQLRQLRCLSTQFCSHDCRNVG